MQKAVRKTGSMIAATLVVAFMLYHVVSIGQLFEQVFRGGQ